MNELKNKIVLITGSNTGIGKATALKFAQEKAIIIITYLKNKQQAKETSKECKKLGASVCEFINLDLRKDKSIRDCVKLVIKKFGKIDILINNAGTFVWKPFNEHSFKEIENLTRTNLEGLMKMTNACIPYIKYSIINISSIGGKQIYKNMAVYTATKFGVRGFTQAIAKENPNLKIYCVNPGTTATQMTDSEGMSPEVVAQKIIDVIKEKITVKSGEDIDIINSSA
ncbi:MAG: SDR family oxidoreductase [archaeon]|nr:SDR family oxidoreductase [archaeon]